MKYRTVIAIAAILAMSACGGPKTIPDNTLGNIFRDIYMVDAFTSQVNNIDYDSVDIYLPVLQKYGYDNEDFLHTLASFSKRKSARLSAIVDDAYNKLSASADSLGRKVNILDYIDSIAFAESKTVVYRDSLIQIRSKADSAAMKLKIPASEGRYTLTYYYLLDSLYGNRNLYNRHYIRNANGRNIASGSVRLTPSVLKKFYTTTLNSPEGADSLEMNFGGYPPNPKRMHLTIDSLVIEYYPTREVALEKLFRSYIDYSPVIAGKKYHEYKDLQTDSSTLHIRPPEAVPEPDTLTLE